MSLDPATSCHRFEREGLELLERGEPLDEHFSSCEDCLEARRIYESLARGFDELPDARPPGAWQARVWSEVARRGSKTRVGAWSWRRLWLGTGALGAAVAAMLLLWVGVPENQPSYDRPALEAEWLPQQAAEHRGGDARPGDSVSLRAVLGGARVAELRLYRDDVELTARCTDRPPCRREGDTLEARFELRNRGIYQPVLLVSEQPLTPGTGDLDTDLGAAFDAGARVELATPITVR